VTLPTWTPPVRVVPSKAHLGDKDISAIYLAVGEALSRWEHAESALIKLYQLLCETDSLAPCRAYGMLTGFTGRADMLKAAADEYFHRRDKADHEVVKEIIQGFTNAAKYRNNIAHGIAAGMNLSGTKEHAGYYLQSPSYAEKKRKERIEIEGEWWMSAGYFYRATEISICSKRFTQLLDATMTRWVLLREKYGGLEGTKVHP
jgi:hypothetical protein